LQLLRKPRKAADIAMFGRMLADSPAFNMEAAVQVAHAITVHSSPVEDDYFSAVDDLNKGSVTRGLRISVSEASGRVCITCTSASTAHFSKRTWARMSRLPAGYWRPLHAVTKVSPTGMQNSHASRAYASYVLAEKGDQQPLAVPGIPQAGQVR
jgi:CRISPR system Cascade subunit CasC